MHIHNLQTDLEDVYNSNDYKVMIESHLNYLIGLKTNNVSYITQQQNYKFEGDFYGLLNEMKIDKRFHYAIMRVNNLSNSNDYKGDRDFITVPSLTELNLLKSILTSKA